MRLKLLGFLALTCAMTDPAHGQAGVPYEPPPVDFADPAAGGPPPPQAGPGGPPAAENERRGPPRPRVEVGGYLEVQQVLSAELAGGGGAGEDVLTYTSVAAGVEGQIETRRVSASGAYRYERRIGLNDDVADGDVHSGVAQLGAELVPGALRFDAGALATRTGGTGRAIGASDREPATEIYSAYAGPSVSARAGPVALNASYRLGYTRVDDDSLAGLPGQGGDFDSVVHSVTASAGMSPGPAPVGWTVAGGYVREEGGDFENQFEARFVRADLVAPLGPTVAVTAGIGYSSIDSSQLDVRRDAAGVPILGPDGRYIPDPTRPRVSSYGSDGIFYDAGILWRPNPRAELQLRAGADEDGNLLVAGSAALQLSRTSGLSASIFNQRSSFGQTMLGALRNLPQQFDVTPNPLTGSLFGGCVFGETPGQGVCIAPALNALTNASFRARGANLIFSGTRRLWTFGAGATYTHRSYDRTDDPLIAASLPADDQDFSLFASASRRLSRDAAIGFNTYATWYDSEMAGAQTVTSFGATVDFSRSFLLERLQLLVALGIAHTSFLGDDSSVANALVGIRYIF